MSASLRTIWISIRATNYAVNTMTGLINQINLAATAEQSLTVSNLNMMKSAMSAGILFGVLGDQIGGVGGQLLHFASYSMYGMAILQGLSAAMRILDSDMLTTTATSIGLEIAWWQVFVAIGAAAGIFMLLKDNVGVIAAGLLAIAAAAAILAVALWSSATAESIMSWGAAAVAGGAAIAGAAAAGLHAAGAFPMGTRMVEQTGPAILHRGEVVYNPATGRPTQIGNDLNAGTGGGLTTIDASIHANTINTKVDTEELSDIVKKQGRKIANDRR